MALTSKEVFKLLSEGFTKEEIIQLEENDKAEPTTPNTDEAEVTKSTVPEEKVEKSEEVKTLETTVETLTKSISDLKKSIQEQAIKESRIETKTKEEVIDEYLTSFINPVKGE